MNKEQAKEWLPLIQALAEGKTIQMKSNTKNWFDVTSTPFAQLQNSDVLMYRIKPEPSQDNIEIAMALEDMAKKIREMKVHCFDFETKAVQAGNGLVCESTFAWQNMNQQVATGGAGGAYANDPKISDWIEWNGGNCPVDDETMVKVKFRGGMIDKDIAVRYYWKHDMCSSDIIAYRIVK